MKKKILWNLLILVALFIFVGCGNKRETNPITDQSDNNKEADSIVEKTYYCSEIEDDDLYYYLYYKNDNLSKVKVLAAKWSGAFESYDEIKEEANSYKGVTISKDSDYVYFNVDIKNDGLDYLIDEFSDLEILKTDKSLSAIDKLSNLECKEQ